MGGQKSNGHDGDGRFAEGNPGGPGRPRRAVEREYLATLADAVTLDDWRAVVQRAVGDAKAGDGKAREWLTRYLLGDRPVSLSNLAGRELRGLTAEADIAAAAEAQERDAADARRLNAMFAKLE